MEFLYQALAISLVVFSFLPSHSISLFTPADNHLVNCGSAADAAVENRVFVSDRTKSPFCHPYSDSSTESLRNEGASSDSAQLYDTARVFRRPSKYEFEISEKGLHKVRIHFSNLNSSKFDPQSSRFHVLIDELVALSNFTSANSPIPVVKEYVVWANSDKLVVRFLPSKPSKFAFVNAIEVISAPKDLVPETAQLVENPDKVENFDVPPNQAYEVVHRITVGGPKVTPFNDSQARTWLPDDEYLRSSSGSEKIYFGGRIKYRIGGSTREIGPNNVYSSARLIRSVDDSIPKVNLTWEFPVTKGFKYLVRTHFCDIGSISLGMLSFNVYINGNLAYKDLDLSELSNWLLASPVYRDFVVDSGESSLLSIGIGPSANMSMAHAIDGILNGVEIMKMNNSMGSFDGPDCSAAVMGGLWGPRSGIGGGRVLILLIAAACVVLSLSVFLRKRAVGSGGESVGSAWSRLPVSESNINKHGV